MADTGEVGAVDSGRTSTRGSASSMKWTAAELLDTAVRRGVDGGRGYGEGMAGMASAMAWESEGEETGLRGVHGWAQRSVVSALDTAGWPEDGREHVGDEIRGGACV